MLANEKMIFLINKRVKKNKGRLISLSSLSSPDLPLFWSGSVVSIAPITINPSKAHLKKLFSRRFQNNRSYMVNPGGKQEIIPASSFNLDPDHLEPWKPVSSLNKFSQFVELDSAMMKPLLMDVHEKTPESLVLSFGIAEKYARYEKVMEFLMSRSEEFKERGFNTSYSISTFKENQDIQPDSPDTDDDDALPLEPRESIFTPPEGTTLKEFGIIKLTAQFVVRFGYEFWVELEKNVFGKTAFDFMKTTTSAKFNSFLVLVNAYEKVLKPYQRLDKPGVSVRSILDDFFKLIEQGKQVEVDSTTDFGLNFIANIEITVQSLSENVASFKDKIADATQIAAITQKLSGKTGVLKDNKSLTCTLQCWSRRYPNTVFVRTLLVDAGKMLFNAVTLFLIDA